MGNVCSDRFCLCDSTPCKDQNCQRGEKGQNDNVLPIFDQRDTQIFYQNRLKEQQQESFEDLDIEDNLEKASGQS